MKRNPLLLYDAQIMNRAGRAMGNIDKILKGLTQALGRARVRAVPVSVRAKNWVSWPC